MGSSETEFLVHPIEPTFDESSQVLILGSFPSAASRTAQYFYGNPRNRFWRVLELIFTADIPPDRHARRGFLLAHGIALWDVIASCEIRGSSDASIRNVVPTDLSRILSRCRIRHIFTNGKKADALYRQFQQEKTGIESTCLPSTSPANASWSLERLAESWHAVRAFSR